MPYTVDNEGKITPAVVPCPFCGSTHIRQTWTEEQDPVLRCWECGSMGPYQTTLQAAIYVWNKRFQYSLLETTE